MHYAVITENDQSEWNDITGDRYHFPARYRRIIVPGTKVIYYKGKQKQKIFSDQRLSAAPHYFGIAEIGSIEEDNESTKNDFYAAVKNYSPFTEAVLAKQAYGPIENIPENKKKNYWRDGVRQIDLTVYNTILALSHVVPSASDNFFDEDYRLSSYGTEGKKLEFYSTRYERIPEYRVAALHEHGYNCKACDFNFEKMYGNLGKNFIHVHHIKPLHTTGEITINPKTDLIPLCPNCHAIIHRQKNRTLTVDELIFVIKKHNRCD